MMEKQTGGLPRWLRQLVAMLLATACAGTALAATDLAPDALAFDYGTGNETRLLRANLQWDWDTQWWQSNGTHVSGYWDASLAAWDARDWRAENGTRTLADLGVTPVFRFEGDTHQGWFLDGGVGANLLSHLYENHRRNFSTAFQFGDLLGVGYQSGSWTAGLTLEHFSNGAIKHPNPGVNFAILSIEYRFHAR